MNAVFNEWSNTNDQKDLDGMIGELSLMIANPINAWVLPYLTKQLEAFELLRKTPLKK